MSEDRTEGSVSLATRPEPSTRSRGIWRHLAKVGEAVGWKRPTLGPSFDTPLPPNMEPEVTAVTSATEPEPLPEPTVEQKRVILAKELGQVPNEELVPQLLGSLVVLQPNPAVIIDKVIAKDLKEVVGKLKAGLRSGDLSHYLDYSEHLIGEISIKAAGRPPDANLQDQLIKSQLLIETIRNRPGLIMEKVAPSLANGYKGPKEPVKTKESEATQSYFYDTKTRSWMLVEGKSTAPKLERPNYFLNSKKHFKHPNVPLWEGSNLSVEVDDQQLYYLDGDRYSIPLDHLKLKSLYSNKTADIYLGVAIPEDLQEYLENLTGSDYQPRVEKLFLDTLVKSIDGRGANKLETAKSFWTVINATDGSGGSLGGIRVYFADTGRINDKRVVLVIGACNKNDQDFLFGKIANSPKR